MAMAEIAGPFTVDLQWPANPGKGGNPLLDESIARFQISTAGRSVTSYETERGDKNDYPPRSRNSKGKIKAAQDILQEVDAAGLLKDGMSILHVRCDAGALLSELRKLLPNATLHGLDYWPNNLRWLREQGFAVEYLNPASIDVPPGIKFDLILSNHLLTHALDPRGDLAKLRSALRDNGRILFYNEYDHVPLFDQASKVLRRSPMTGYHKRLFIRPSFESFLRSAGFKPHFLGYRRDIFMMYLAQPVTESQPDVQVAREILDYERSLVLVWHKMLRKYLSSKHPARIALRDFKRSVQASLRRLKGKLQTSS
jgi:2-polyprenyl-3-methyl-5-hydroxy-6-metoxy-1,4-benzoquinol methylase